VSKSGLAVLVDFGAAGGFGPGKAQLLERIEEAGSIAAAARAMGMSYRRAWLMVAGMNRCFADVVVETNRGGRRGGGARVTETGRRVVAAYRQLERAADRAAAPHLARLDRMLAP
jgi:molybdate transport system regulatory protein